MAETRLPGPGHNQGPPLDPMQSWRRHCWRAARKQLFRPLPLETVRRRVKRAAALGLAYRRYELLVLGGGEIEAMLFADDTLVVYLPGSGMIPEDHDLVVRMAGWAGYRAIGLSYDSRDTIGSICVDSAGDALDCSFDCHEQVHLERILGPDYTSSLPLGTDLVTNWHDAIVPRLWEVLDAMHTADPTAGWDAYYNPAKALPRPRPGDIYWENILLAGHSQGGAHALYMFQYVHADGLVLTEGGNDVCPDASGNEIAADWYDPTGGASAGEPRIAFGHRRGASPSSFALPPGMVAAGFVVGDGLDVGWWTVADGELAHTNQTPAPGGPGVSGGCTDHKSMARDTCMPTDVGSGAEAVFALDAHLFDAYVDAFEAAGL